MTDRGSKGSVYACRDEIAPRDDALVAILAKPPHVLRRLSVSVVLARADDSRRAGLSGASIRAHDRA